MRMTRAFAKCLVVFSYIAGLVTALLWGAMWSGAVEREYVATPTGSHELWTSIGFDLGGALFAGFVVYWLLRGVANRLLDERPPSVSPADVVKFSWSLYWPDRPENPHPAPLEIGRMMLTERLMRSLGRMFRRFRRIIA